MLVAHLVFLYAGLLTVDGSHQCQSEHDFQLFKKLSYRRETAPRAVSWNLIFCCTAGTAKACTIREWPWTSLKVIRVVATVSLATIKQQPLSLVFVHSTQVLSQSKLSTWETTTEKVPHYLLHQHRQLVCINKTNKPNSSKRHSLQNTTDASHDNKSTQHIFTARRYASEVCAVTVCLSVCLSVRLS